ncbi:thioesterase II family protein [Streptomyces sp. NPDC058757]|uniref:thioesterase II family protein n=1 Tax=Streptomyces sp. NPDC058757 TaxID=3346626 RepID=UPI0036A6B620
MDSEWLRRFAVPGGDSATAGGTALVCFPHAGGAASAYVPLARALAPAVPVLAVQYPGRQDRGHERPLDDIGELADALAAEVRRAVEGPYAFFGHSMGATLAYETARRLRADGRPGPRHLFLSARRAPSPDPGPRDRPLTDADVMASVRRLGGTPPAVLDDPELREMVMPALRADYRAVGRYAWRPGPPLDVPIGVFVGDADPVVAVEQAAAWRDFTTAPTTLEVFRGGHFYLDRHLPAVARSLTAALAAPAAFSSSESGRT